MKYMAKQSAFWEDDTGHLVHIVGRVTVVESERDLCNDRPPYFYPIEEKADGGKKTQPPKNKGSLIENLYKMNPKARIIASEEID